MSITFVANASDKDIYACVETAIRQVEWDLSARINLEIHDLEAISNGIRIGGGRKVKHVYPRHLLEQGLTRVAAGGYTDFKTNGPGMVYVTVEQEVARGQYDRVAHNYTVGPNQSVLIKPDNTIAISRHNKLFVEETSGIDYSPEKSHHRGSAINHVANATGDTTLYVRCEHFPGDFSYPPESQRTGVVMKWKNQHKPGLRNWYNDGGFTAVTPGNVKAFRPAQGCAYLTIVADLGGGNALIVVDDVRIAQNLSVIVGRDGAFYHTKNGELWVDDGGHRHR